MNYSRVIIATLIATVVAFSIHVYWTGTLLPPLFDAAALRGEMPDSNGGPTTYVTVVAAITALIPTACRVIGYFFVGGLIPAKNRFVKGAVYGVILLAIQGELVRQPLMQFVVGNPIHIVLIQGAEAWIIYLLMGMLIGALVPYREYEIGRPAQVY